jgi:hypothetical protein
VIDFRYHLVSIVAVFLALAIGIVIGASAIKPGVLNVLNNASSHEQRQISQAQATIRNLQNELSNNQAFAQANAPRLLSGLLEGQPVVVVTAPGADAATVNGITTALKLAGAKITTQAELQPSFFDTSTSTQNSLETLAQQVAPPGLLLQPGANPQIAGQQEASQVLAAALVTKGTDLSPDQVGIILNEFTRQGFLQLSPVSGPAAPPQATLAVVIAPGSPPSADADPANLALISAAEQLRLSSPSHGGVVLAGSQNGSGPGSVIDELISGSTGAQLSSVDNADKEVGQILVVQALSYLLTGHKPAAYGTGAVPSPAPTPSATPSAAAAAAPRQSVRA